MSCNNNSTPDYDPTLPSSKPNNLTAPQPITFSVENVYPHHAHAFTQGLDFHNVKLSESTVETKESTLRVVDLKTGKPENDYRIPDHHMF